MGKINADNATRQIKKAISDRMSIVIEQKTNQRVDYVGTYLKNDAKINLFFDISGQKFGFVMYNNGSKTFDTVERFSQMLFVYLYINTEFIPLAQQVANLYTAEMGLVAKYETFTGNNADGFTAKFEVLGTPRFLCIKEKENHFLANYVESNDKGGYRTIDSLEFILQEDGSFEKRLTIPAVSNKLFETCLNSNNKFNLNRVEFNRFVLEFDIFHIEFAIEISNIVEYRILQVNGEDVDFGVVLDDFLDIEAFIAVVADRVNGKLPVTLKNEKVDHSDVDVDESMVSETVEEKVEEPIEHTTVEEPVNIEEVGLEKEEEKPVVKSSIMMKKKDAVEELSEMSGVEEPLDAVIIEDTEVDEIFPEEVSETAETVEKEEVEEVSQEESETVSKEDEKVSLDNIETEQNDTEQVNDEVSLEQSETVEEVSDEVSEKVAQEQSETVEEHTAEKVSEEVAQEEIVETTSDEVTEEVSQDETVEEETENEIEEQTETIENEVTDEANSDGVVDDNVSSDDFVNEEPEKTVEEVEDNSMDNVQDNSMDMEQVTLDGINLEDITVRKILDKDNKIVSLLFDAGDNLFIASVESLNKYLIPYRRIKGTEQIIEKKGYTILETEKERKIFAVDISENADIVDILVKALF